jgi:hypothetical protein
MITPQYCLELIYGEDKYKKCLEWVESVIEPRIIHQIQANPDRRWISIRLSIKAENPNYKLVKDILHCQGFKITNIRFINDDYVCFHVIW